MEPCAENFPHRIVETLRFADTDRNGHITSSVFAICCQSGRLALLSDPARALAPLTSQFVLARITLEYRREMHWPGTVEIGTRIEQIGRSSIMLAQALFHGNRCVATAQSVAVLMNTTTRRAQPIPQVFVESLQGFAGHDHATGAGLALRHAPILVHTNAAIAPASALHPPDDV